MKISIEEYKKAKEIVILYEREQQRLEDIILEDFKKELGYFFLNNGKLVINEFELRKEYSYYQIIPTKPYFDESYGGELDDDIEKLSKKYNIDAAIISWCYPK